ncbi:MAG: alpha/beta fold hydrolase [Rhizobiales bacterium]|nr:alpha/beta fold hydrolase [Hyphomicrobiales bacterium]MBI3672998.1 alpha/beta fold hydrolase [Hyphomicrobiales bacterium]
MTGIQFETGLPGRTIAFREDASSDRGLTGFFWLGGFKSDMEGTKAEAVAGLARDTRRPALRFDYSGHGRSGGDFSDGTISGWLEEALAMFGQTAPTRRIIVGSSMGGWLALLLLRRLIAGDRKAAARIGGLVLIAPAVDMTADLMWDIFPPEARAAIERDGVWHRPSLYGEPYPITARLIADGARHLLLEGGVDCPCPVRILQGDTDPDVPAFHAAKLFGALRGADVTLTLIKGGDHRLSSPTQLSLIRETVLALAQRADGITP